MRMWMTDPSKMCRQHLLGEHNELHMFVGTLNVGIKVTKYLLTNLLEPRSIKKRHSLLVKEMKRRGYNHKSPLPKFSLKNLTKAQRDVEINILESERELLRRCITCRGNYDEKISK